MHDCEHLTVSMGYENKYLSLYFSVFYRVFYKMEPNIEQCRTQKRKRRTELMRGKRKPLRRSETRRAAKERLNLSPGFLRE